MTTYIVVYGRKVDFLSIFLGNMVIKIKTVTSLKQGVL